MLSLGQRLVVVITGIVLLVNLFLFFPWWLAALGAIACAPFMFAVIIK